MKEKEYWESTGHKYKKKSVLIPQGGPLINKYIRYTQHRAFKGIEDSLCGKKVLEIGCGNGYWFDYYRSWGAGEVAGVDLSKPMLTSARTKGNVVQASAVALPFQDEAFDAVVTVTALQHLSSKDELRNSLSEISRVLKREGGLSIMLELSQKHTVSLSAPLFSQSRQEWVDMFQENGLSLVSSKPVDPSILTYVFDMMAFKTIRFLSGIRRGSKKSKRTLSSVSRIVTPYYLVKEVLIVPSFLFVDIVKRLCPSLSAHWIYVLSKK